MSTPDEIPNLKAILVKVRKLRDLAARSTSVAEAATAASQADAILQRYRLSEADAEVAGAQPTEAIGEAEEPLWSGGARTDTVAMRLAASLAGHYGCVAYRSRAYCMGRAESTSLRIVGRPSDVEIVRYMFAWLRAEIERLAQREAGPMRNSFRHGAVTGIDLAITASTRQTVRNAPGSGAAALVLASRAEEAKRWLSTVDPKMGKARAPGGNLDPDAFMRGARAGAQMPGVAKLPEGRGRMLGVGEDVDR